MITLVIIVCLMVVLNIVYYAYKLGHSDGASAGFVKGFTRAKEIYTKWTEAEIAAYNKKESELEFKRKLDREMDLTGGH
jgi:hypothetical protein